MKLADAFAPDGRLIQARTGTNAVKCRRCVVNGKGHLIVKAPGIPALVVAWTEHLASDQHRAAIDRPIKSGVKSK